MNVYDKGESFHINNLNNKIISIAPMLDVTYREFRYFTRMLTKHTQLWTEMITAASLIHNPEMRDTWLKFDDIEQDLVAQLGGRDIEMMSTAAEIVANYGYKEVNINVGCPSSRVSIIGSFGACLMKDSDRVRDIVSAIRKRVNIPVTVKTRIGVDDMDSEEFLSSFINNVSSGGCDHFIIHARKAYLKGINPKKNRSIPPLEYDRVYRLIERFPHIKFTLNGGIKSVDQARDIMEKNPQLNGVMIGRMAYENPIELYKIDHLFVCNNGVCNCDGENLTREKLLRGYMEYIDNRNFTNDSNINMIIKPLHGLYRDKPGSGAYRRILELVCREYTLNRAIDAIEKVIDYMLENHNEVTTEIIKYN